MFIFDVKHGITSVLLWSSSSRALLFGFMLVETQTEHFLSRFRLFTRFSLFLAQVSLLIQLINFLVLHSNNFFSYSIDLIIIHLFTLLFAGASLLLSALDVMVPHDAFL